MINKLIPEHLNMIIPLNCNGPYNLSVETHDIVFNDAYKLLIINLKSSSRKIYREEDITYRTLYDFILTLKQKAN